MLFGPQRHPLSFKLKRAFRRIATEAVQAPGPELRTAVKGILASTFGAGAVTKTMIDKAYNYAIRMSKSLSNLQ